MINDESLGLSPKRRPGRRGVLDVLLLAVVALAAAVAAYKASRLAYFPTDLDLARWVQTNVPMPDAWAHWIGRTADIPGCFVLLAGTVVVAWLVSGWRAAACAVPIFLFSLVLGHWLQPIVARPRPSADLIGVSGTPTGFGFPSIFALVYMTTFGYIAILAWVRGRGSLSLLVTILSVAALLIGLASRVALGVHWPSDLWGGCLIGLFWILAFLPFSR
ncbi:phosphoesterase PA-phosphatase related protein [Desulfovibrio sp. X2]|uniref:phosphatase PAP2 family protein n=1 Tax=Desulfovibrio sp. X2 TaxID=941449 RepID=UPI0003588EEF|nr:phosphatase PAP2 family protein [Desulfovibrio sp. X2]EPR42131.1 phosphoesterase PA-phosphatase related protein [Desulfovibrio sp. X2]